MEPQNNSYFRIVAADINKYIEHLEKHPHLQGRRVSDKVEGFDLANVTADIYQRLGRFEKIEEPSLQTALKNLHGRVLDSFTDTPVRQKFILTVEKWAGKRLPQSEEPEKTRAPKRQAVASDLLAAKDLEALEKLLPEGFFPPPVRVAGKIVDPVKQWQELSQILLGIAADEHFDLDDLDSVASLAEIANRAAERNLIRVANVGIYPPQFTTKAEALKFLESPEECEAILSSPFLHASYLTLLPPQLFKPGTVHSTLNIAANPLRFLPPAISQIKFTRLDASATKLSSLPDSLANVVGLSELILSETPLKTIPKVVFALPMLTLLNLESTQIEELSSEIGALLKLEELHIANNQLTTLPRELGALALKGLDITANPFAGGTPAVLADLRSLQWLQTSLDINQLRQIVSPTVRIKQLMMPAAPSPDFALLQKNKLAGVYQAEMERASREKRFEDARRIQTLLNEL